MRIQSPVLITLSLLGIMAMVALISAIVGFKVGAIALEGVSQPEANPAKKFANGKYELDAPKAFQSISEKKIINQVYNTIQRKSKAFKPNSPKPSPSSPDSSTELASKPSSQPNHAGQLPLQAQDQGVILRVESVAQSGNSLVLGITIKNESDRARQFLYSFLELKDEDGRTLSGITEGLPEEIPPKSQLFRGQVKIPRGLVQDNQKITLNLSNYPDQSLTLSVKDIPLLR